MKNTYVSLRLTVSEAELLYREFECAIGCGALDPDYPRVRDKVFIALRKFDRALNNKYNKESYIYE